MFYGTWLLACYCCFAVQARHYSIKQLSSRASTCTFTATDQKAHEIPCQLAMFGAYHPANSAIANVVFAEPLMACSDLLNSELITENRPTVIVVKRGGCTFTKKLLNVESFHGAYMILLNSENELIEMTTLDWIQSSTKALAITSKDGEILLKERNAAWQFQISVPHTKYDQCYQRVMNLIQNNAPMLAFESALDCHNPSYNADIFNFDIVSLQLQQSSQDNHSEITLAENPNRNNEDTKAFEYYYKISKVFYNSKWDSIDHISLRFAILALRYQEQQMDQNSNETKNFLEMLGTQLLQGGYFQLSILFFNKLTQLEHIEQHSPYHCDLALATFLQGRIAKALKTYSKCLNPSQKYQQIQVAETNLRNLFALILEQDSDFACLNYAETGMMKHSAVVGSSCCPLYDEGKRNVKLEIYNVLTQMGVFLDEIGAIHESNIFFQYSLRVCGEGSGIDFWLAVNTPVVYSSAAEVQMYYQQVQQNLQDLLNLHNDINFIDEVEEANSLSGPAKATISIETFAYLEWTITPPTMMLVYQGNKLLEIQRNLHKMFDVKYPIGSSSSSNIINTESTASPLNPRKKIGFLSSWFRSHSVGKLMLGVMERLDKAKFQIFLLLPSHFFQIPDALTVQFQIIADTVVNLPKSLEIAKDLIQTLELDVLIFPEIGMDMWVMLLARYRLAPVQCMFWGHPITSGNAMIDYFISSEYFHSFSQNLKLEPTRSAIANEYSDYSEQLVLFNGLSTFFPKPNISPKVQLFHRHMLHLPEHKRIYLCPQTLMKLHPDFDTILKGILETDSDAVIVLIYSRAQVFWKEKLLTRFFTVLKELTWRILFLPKQPYDHFLGLLSVSDVMLDTYPFGGGVTTLDAFSVGLPVVTLPGKQTVVQLTTGFYRYMGVPDCIVRSDDEYIKLSVQIASNVPFKTKIKQNIIKNHHKLYADTETTKDWDAFLSNI